MKFLETTTPFLTNWTSAKLVNEAEPLFLNVIDCKATSVCSDLVSPLYNVKAPNSTNASDALWVVLEEVTLNVTGATA